MNLRLRSLSLTLAMFSYFTFPARSQQEIGFLEKFALAPDRAAVLTELIAGTEDYYFYHALHYQQTGKTKELEKLLKQWSERNEHSPLLREIKHRQALLTYETSPQETLAYLKNLLHPDFSHAQQTLNPKPNLPVAVDNALIAEANFLRQALRDPNQIVGLNTDGIAYLLNHATPLTGPQRRQLLTRVERPDAPGLVKLILDDLATDGSKGFGEFPIHRQLLVGQFAELAKASPDLMTNTNFVFSWLGKLRPNADVNLERDSAAREAWLGTAWDFVKDLAPVFNSLKAAVLYQRLLHDQKLGQRNADRFLTYLKLPRQLAYVNEKYRSNQRIFEYPVDLGADLSSVLGCAPIGNEEPLVRDYLLALLAAAPDFKAYASYLENDYLKTLLAEAKLTSAQGDAEKWFPMLSPSSVQQLRERVDLDFDPTNPPVIAPGAEVSLDLWIKNVPHLSISLFEINTANYYRANLQQIGTDLNLDGLLSNVQQSFDYAETPIQRVKRNFKFPQLNGKRGVWMVDFIGNGKSSRALIRKGQLHYLARPSSAGTTLVVLDEELQPLPKATALVATQEFTANEHGEIFLPFSNKPGPQPIVLSDGAGFAQLETIPLEGENYALTSGFHVPHESLVSGQKATVAIRPTFTVNGVAVDVSLLEEVTLTIASTNLDGTNSTVVQPDFKLTPHREATFEFAVPDRLQSLNFTLEAKVKSLITGEKISLTTQGQTVTNSLDRSLLTTDLYFSRLGENYYLQILGRTGEPRAEQIVEMQFRRTEFSEPLGVQAKTDAKGSILLGSLVGIWSIEAKFGAGQQRNFLLPKDQFTAPANLHVAQGEVVTLPWMGGNALDAQQVSLLEIRRDTFVRNALSEKTAAIKAGYLVLQNLEPGDYSLRYGQPARLVTLRVTQGKLAGNFLIGPARSLETSPYNGLQIMGVSQNADSLTIAIGHSGPDTRVHVLASRFVPDFDAFAPLGIVPTLEPMMGTPASLLSLYLSGRTLGEEYRYVLDRRSAKIFPGSLLPRPGLLLNPWAIRDTNTTIEDALAGEEFGKASDGAATKMARSVTKQLSSGDKLDAKQGPVDPGISSVNFLARTGVTLFNLEPDKDGMISIKRADLGDRQFLRILAVDGDSSAMRDLSLPDAATAVRDLTLHHGLDPQGHFTRQNQITILEKDAPYVITDATTTQFELSADLGQIFTLFRTLGKDATLNEFAFILDWPKLEAARKQELYSQYACHELSFFLQRKDPAFFKAVILPYLANKRDQTFLDHYLLGHDLQSFLTPWRYGRLNAVERILLAQRHPEQAPATSREIRELWSNQPVSVGQELFFFESLLSSGSLSRADYAIDALGITDRAPMSLEGLAMPAAPAPQSAASAMLRDEPANQLGEKKKELAQLAEMDADMPTLAKGGADKRGRLMAEGREAAGREIMLRRKLQRSFFRQQPPTQEWAENNYYHLLIAQQLADRVGVNAFWKDYAAWDGKGRFVSTQVAEASHNFTEMMLALAVLDLPFPGEAAAVKSEIKDQSITLTPSSKALLFHREIKPAEIDKEAPKLLVSQNFYRDGDRYLQQGNEKLDKFVTEEFLTGVVYGCQVVVTNPTSSTQKLDLLVQIPQGAIPVAGHKATNSLPLSLEAYHTHTMDYAFYFPTAGKYAQHPVHVSKSEKVVAFAEPFTFNVVNELTKLDTKSWDYVSQFGTAEEVLAFLDANNVHQLPLVKMAWRMHDAAFFAKALALLTSRHAFDETLWAYSLLHNAPVAVEQYLLHQDPFLNECGPALTSKLVNIDPIERLTLEHLEYSPLVNARAHQLGKSRSILNDRLFAQYNAMLNALAHQRTLTPETQLAVTYYLLLQDRVEEAIAAFAAVEATKVREHLQYDYLKAVLACYQEDVASARQIATAHAQEPVNRWREKFVEIIAQLDEIDGAKAAAARENSREQRQNELAASEPSLDFTVENKEIRLKYHQLKEATVNYYPMDLEFLFSTAPFVSSDTSRFRMIQPNKTERLVLEGDKDAHTLALPKEYHSSNVLVEITSAGKTAAHAYYANSLNIIISEGQGLLQVLHAGDNRPLPKTYVKVFAEIDGQPKFYKDGYTDLRGKFDYLSLSTPGLNSATKFGILILSAEHGAAVKEVAPPPQ